jgi:hypothetical protein
VSGPYSLPNGDKAFWNELNMIVCNNHFECDMAKVDEDGNPITHDYITYREWLYRRNKLRTGKTL